MQERFIGSKNSSFLWLEEVQLFTVGDWRYVRLDGRSESDEEGSWSTLQVSASLEQRRASFSNWTSSQPLLLKSQRRGWRASQRQQGLLYAPCNVTSATAHPLSWLRQQMIQTWDRKEFAQVHAASKEESQSGAVKTMVRVRAFWSSRLSCFSSQEKPVSMNTFKTKFVRQGQSHKVWFKHGGTIRGLHRCCS